MRVCKVFEGFRITVYATVVIAIGEGILASIDENLLKTCPLTKDLAKSVFTPMGIVKRKVSSKAKINVEGLPSLKKYFYLM